jgi:alpha-galactosidase
MADQSFLDGRIIFHPQAGTLSLPSPGAWASVHNAIAAVHYRLGRTPHRLALTGPGVSFGVGENLVTFSHHDDHLRLDWSWTTIDDALEGWLEVINLGDARVALDRLDVLDLTGASSLVLPGPVADWRVYQNGWQTWAPTGVRRVRDGPFPTPLSDEYRLSYLPHGDGLRSEWVTVIAAPIEHAANPASAAEVQRATPRSDFAHWLLGFVTGADQLAEVILDADDEFRHLSATCHADGFLLEPGESLRSEQLRVTAGSNGWQLLETWAERMGKLMRARIPEKTPTGWCTWYYYFGSNTAQDVYANLNAIRRQRLPLDIVLIDDGYQVAIGDWLELHPARFMDMAAVAATVRREGRIPGIWTAPFGLAAGSRTFADHPDWVLHDEAGEPVLAWHHASQPIYALDTTHPGAVDWLDATFRTMRREWGYDAFKVDFLFAAALPGRRYAPQVTRAQALRRGLAIIRDAIGDDAFLLGCGAPLGPAVGLVDGMRIGPDVSPAWESLRAGDLSAPGTANALRNSIARAFTHRRLWAADPDCLLARPRSAKSQLSLYEARTLATVLALTGGMLLDSDLVGDLPPSRLAMLRQVLPPTGRTACPVDLFERDLPEILVLPVERPWGRWWLAGQINWSEHTRTTRVELAALGLPPGRYHVYDQWRASYLGQTEGPLTLPDHRPHEALLLLFKPVTDRPDWLTSTFHLAAGSIEVTDVIQQKLGERRLKLVVHLEQPGENFGRLVFTVPAGWIVLEAQVNGRRRSVNVRNGEAGLVDMGFTLRGRAWVLVDFARVR